MATVCREVCLTNYTVSHLVERSYDPLVACISGISRSLSSEYLMSAVYIILLYATLGTISVGGRGSVRVPVGSSYIILLPGPTLFNS